jgi:hypothetical protein
MGVFIFYLVLSISNLVFRHLCRQESKLCFNWRSLLVKLSLVLNNDNAYLTCPGYTPQIGAFLFVLLCPLPKVAETSRGDILVS